MCSTGQGIVYAVYTVHSEGKPVIGPMIFEEPKYLYDEMKITDKCVFCEGRPKNFKESAAEGDIQM